MRRILHCLVLAAIAGALGVGCSSTESDWQAAVKANTAESYTRFMKAHPRDPHVAEARERTDWLAADHEGTFKAYFSFYLDYPTSAHKAEIQRKVIERANYVAYLLWQRTPWNGEDFGFAATAIGLMPQNPYFLCLRGVNQYLKQRFADARQSFRDALAASGDQPVDSIGYWCAARTNNGSGIRVEVVMPPQDFTEDDRKKWGGGFDPNDQMLLPEGRCMDSFVYRPGSPEDAQRRLLRYWLEHHYLRLPTE